MTQRSGGEFDDNPTVIAITAKGAAGFGFRCQGDELKVIFITPEKISDDSMIETMNTAKPQLRIKIDGGPVITLDADLDNPDDKLAVASDTDRELVKSVATAKSKVSVVLTVIGQNFHETTFNVRGSTAALNKMMTQCKAD